VVGEEEMPPGGVGGARHLLDEPTRQALSRGEAELITETQLWQRLGLVETEQDIHRLYTPAMLAELLGVEVSLVRRWHRRGLLKATREVRRLPYFDFREVATARRLCELLSAGVSPAAIERKLAELARALPAVERPLADLSIVVVGKQLLVRHGDGLTEPGGQFRFDFESAEAEMPPVDVHDFHSPCVSLASQTASPIPTRDEMLRFAADLEDEGCLDAAAEMYRAAMAASGPTPEVNFQLAEVLYRMGELPAARERYYSAIELDENYVEARANLGCVLAETGQRDLAVAAFEGALAYHGDYADVYYHLARTLDEMDRGDEADRHWRSFLSLAPESPWAAEARHRLQRRDNQGQGAPSYAGQSVTGGDANESDGD
jgi:tetratricopeptide (TPR) repeat protein